MGATVVGTAGTKDGMDVVVKCGAHQVRIPSLVILGWCGKVKQSYSYRRDQASLNLLVHFIKVAEGGFTVLLRFLIVLAFQRKL